MKLFKKCAAVLLTAMLASSLLLGCDDKGGDEPSGPSELNATIVFSPKAGAVDSGKKISLSTKEKDADIYYELVASGKTSALTSENYKEVATKYTAPIPVTEALTIYAVVVKGSAVSKVAKAEYKMTIAGPDSNFNKLHDMILPSGTGAEIPAWTKAANAYATDLDEIVTGFTTKESNYTQLNGKTNRTKKLLDTVDEVNKTNFFDDKEVKNVIFVFADGWGESHILGSRQYYNDGVLAVDHLPYHAPVNHNSYVKRASDEAVTWTYFPEENKWWHFKNSTDNTSFTTTDSTAGGTAINTGFTTYYKSCDCDLEGTEVKNILELAREKGMLVGDVTNDWLSDATPVTVAVHSPKRDDSTILMGRMFLASPDFAMGNGGFTSFINASDPIAEIKKQDKSEGDAAESAKTIWDGSKYVADSKEKVQGHISQWVDANLPKLKTWAISMLNEYDKKSLTGTEYDFTAWKTDRNMESFSTFKKAIEAVDADITKRPLVSFNKTHDFKYDGDAYDKKTGKYYTAPALGYKLGYGNPNGEQVFPNFAEMVASTLSILDKKAKAENRGFFAFIENTCPDGWGHKNEQYDCINEMQITDEAVAIAMKYVLENPDTLLVVSADHETGGVQYTKGWETDYTAIVSLSNGDHSKEPVPVFAFGAGAKANWGDVPQFDMKDWTADEKAAWVKGDYYPDPQNWAQPHWSEATKAADPSKFPKILRNRTTGMRIGKAMGFDKYGDLDGNGVLDPVNEADSVVSYDKVGTFGKN